MVQRHHAAFTFPLGRGAYKEFLGNLNFRWSQLFADLVALCSGENVAPFHHHDLAHFNSFLVPPVLAVFKARSPSHLVADVIGV
jgi:hypothetical protein